MIQDSDIMQYFLTENDIKIYVN